MPEDCFWRCQDICTSIQQKTRLSQIYGVDAAISWGLAYHDECSTCDHENTLACRPTRSGKEESQRCNTVITCAMSEIATDPSLSCECTGSYLQVLTYSSPWNWSRFRWTRKCIHDLASKLGLGDETYRFWWNFTNRHIMSYIMLFLVMRTGNWGLRH